MKKVLISSTDLMMVQFLLPHVVNLSEHGYEVDLACSNVGGRLDEVREKVGSYVRAIHEVRLHRSPLSMINLKGYGDMKDVMRKNKYDVIWTNEPVMGVVTRLCAKEQREQGTKVIYMTHGFHFFHGAPKMNWIFYYPIEKIMARYADTIVTINREDFERAKTFCVQNVEYIHGIGINTDRLSAGNKRGNIREELGIKNDDILVLSIGELNSNKNQQIIIKAIAIINDPKIHFILCGKGDKLDYLKELSCKLGISNNVHFLGYRRDVVDICSQADIYVMPSKREGLGVASLEAMFCGLPLVTSNIHGLKDLNKNGKNGYLLCPTDVDGFAKAIKMFMEHPEKRKEMGIRNKQEVIPFTIEKTKKEILDIIQKMI